MTQTTDPIRELDVRPILASGQDPFGAIMDVVGSLPPGTSLRLIAPFQPTPLFSVMARQGYAAAPRQRGDGAWEVLFSPDTGSTTEQDLSPGSNREAMFWPDPAQSLDLTGLMPPEPMVRILATLEDMAPGEVLFALLEREPVFLFPELSAREHDWAGNLAADGAGYRLLIRRGGEK
ncbi:DUF2249 domain-containing protein [Paracoccus marinaquae]|uniref:DUF2249 domain-containing protein n=1 Tax=Paracoccus marinaquae TaxID=2841926 RepID=A0ABS6AJ17_9RHOB|nr:DUF2249 domain-containing protein [Paracoccus marinaquae]MBU3030590.1 DUF2249 domain-containing protein [Paracoccus marinaquae]